MSEAIKPYGQASAGDYVKSGRMPFFRLPYLDEARARGIQPLAAVIGVPFDGGTTHRPGARFAPFAIREASPTIQSVHPTHRVDVFGSLRAVDAGNVFFPPFHAETVRAAIRSEIRGLIALGATPYLVGGDHSITLPSLRAIAERHGPVALIHLDAHLDTSGAEIWGEEFHHGTFLRHAIQEGLVARGKLFQVGLRAPWASEHEESVVRAHEALGFPAATLERRSADELGREIRSAIGQTPTYLSFDVDAIDPAFAPGTGTPVPGGLSSREAIQLFRALAGIPLVGMDVVEVSPDLDPSKRTAHLAAHLVYEALALQALGFNTAR